MEPRIKEAEKRKEDDHDDQDQGCTKGGHKIIPNIRKTPPNFLTGVKKIAKILNNEEMCETDVMQKKCA